jgi:hypothetical protein
MDIPQVEHNENCRAVTSLLKTRQDVLNILNRHEKTGYVVDQKIGDLLHVPINYRALESCEIDFML